ncbi:MAG: class I SAM-dependent methyltransferase [Candidatus Aquicultorales bacterium]
MAGQSEIARFFDDMAVDRDEAIDASPAVRYEQAVRQQAVLKLIGDNRYRRILDVGCGNGRDLDALAALRPEATVVGLDFSPNMVREASSRMARQGFGNIEVKVGDACALPFPGDYFDAIVCSEVVEHIPDYGAALTEFGRVLRPGGCAVLTTPNKRSLYGLDRRFLEWKRSRAGKKPWPHAFDSWKTPREMRAALSERGFRIAAQVGICYLPGFILLGRAPEGLQRQAVLLTRLAEPLFSVTLRGSGYMMGFLARKEADAGLDEGGRG